MDDHLKQDAIIEDALHSQSMAKMPRSIKTDVMSRIQKDKRPSIFTWKDIVLAFGLVFSFRALLYALQNLPPILLAKLRIQGILVYQEFLIGSHSFGESLSYAVLAVFSILFLQYLYRLVTNKG